GDARALGAQAQRGQWSALPEEPPDELGGEVLGLGRAAPVPGGEQPRTPAQPLGELGTPAIDDVRLPTQARHGAVQLPAVRTQPRVRAHTASTSTAALVVHVTPPYASDVRRATRSQP